MQKADSNKSIFGETVYPGLGYPDAFYDRSLRLWTLLWKDERGDQIGEAQYFPLKHLMMRSVLEDVRAAGLVPDKTLEGFLAPPKTSSAPSP